MKRIAALILVMSFCLGFLACAAESETLIQAHAGASSIAPENTLSAFLAAKEAGADGIETDIRMTKDHQLVLRHDDAIDSTSNGHGNISEMTLEELRAFDFGGWYGPDYAGETILTLEELLRAAKEMDFQALNLEMKPTRDNKGEFVQAVADVIEQSGLMERIMVSSFDANLLRQLKAYAPDIAVALLTIPDLSTVSYFHLANYLPENKPVSEYTPEDVANVPEALGILLSGFGIPGDTPQETILEALNGIAAVAPEDYTWNDVERAVLEQADLIQYVDGLGFHIDYLNCHHTTLNAQIMAAMRARGIGVNVWTPDTAPTLEKMLALHPDGIITNELETALALRDEATAEEDGQV